MFRVCIGHRASCNCSMATGVFMGLMCFQTGATILSIYEGFGAIRWYHHVGILWS